MILTAGIFTQTLQVYAAVRYDADGQPISTSEPPYLAYLGIETGAETQEIPGDMNIMTTTFSDDGDDYVSVTFSEESNVIHSLTLKTNINAYAYLPDDFSAESDSFADNCSLSISITSIEIRRITGQTDTLSLVDTPANNSLRIDDDGTICYDIWSDTVENLEGDANADENGYQLENVQILSCGDTLTVYYTISGIADTSYSKGDVNQDGTITTIDAYLAQVKFSELAAGNATTLTQLQYLAADVDGNNTINSLDAYYIQKYAAELAAGNSPTWKKNNPLIFILNLQ